MSARFNEGGVWVAQNNVITATLRLAILDDDYVFDATHTMAANLNALIDSATHRGDAALQTVAISAAGVVTSDNCLFSDAANTGGGSTKDVILYIDPNGTDDSGDEVALVHYNAGTLPLTVNGGDLTLITPAGGWFTV